MGVTLTLAGCAESEGETLSKAQARHVETFTIDSYADKRVSNYLGRVRAPKEVNLAFELAGKVDWIASTTGESYQAGDKLGSLDAKRYELAFAAANQRLTYAMQNLARMEKLLAGGSSTVAEFDQVENIAILAEIEMERAKQDLEDSVLYAPFDGKLAAKQVEKGSFVSPGQPVLVFQETGTTEVDFYQTEKQLSHLLSGLRMGSTNLQFADEELKDLELDLKDYATLPDSLSGSYRTTLVLSNSRDDLLLPGAPIRVEVTEDLSMIGATPVAIPANALVSLPSGGFQVWVLENGADRPKARSVELGRVGAKSVEVLGGLGLGDRVITSGSSLLREDTLITADFGV